MSARGGGAAPDHRPYFGSVGGVTGEAEGEPGWFDMVESPGCGAALVGGVDGMLVDGFTEVSVEGEELDDPMDEEPIDPIGDEPIDDEPMEEEPFGRVAEVSVEAPVAALEPAHQSLLARALGEAFR